MHVHVLNAVLELALLHLVSLVVCTGRRGLTIGG